MPKSLLRRAKGSTISAIDHFSHGHFRLLVNVEHLIFKASDQPEIKEASPRAELFIPMKTKGYSIKLNRPGFIVRFCVIE